MQLKSADITDRLKSKKTTITTFVFLQAFMLLPMLIISLQKKTQVASFITLVVLFTSFGAVALPAWASLMSDLVDADKRGRYFGWRNKRLGFILVAASLTAGIILHYTKRIDAFLGFSILFGLAFIFRIVSWYFLTRMYEPQSEGGKGQYFSLFDFLVRLRESNFAKFVVFVAMMNFSVNMVSPFFAVLMLRELRFGYLLYTVITIVATLTIYVTMNRWGRHADRVGNLKIIKFCSPIIAMVPLLWIFNRNPIFLLFAQTIAGFAWSGFNLCASNYIYDAVSSNKLTRCISYFNVINGLAICAGALLGGLLAQRLPTLFGYRILALCLISSILRFVVALYMLPRLKEVRSVEKVHNKQLFFSMIGIRSIPSVE
jgi:MFS family permease